MSCWLLSSLKKKQMKDITQKMKGQAKTINQILWKQQRMIFSNEKFIYHNVFFFSLIFDMGSQFCPYIEHFPESSKRGVPVAKPPQLTYF